MSVTVMQPFLAINYIIALEGIAPQDENSKGAGPLIGAISIFADMVLPRGWALCDGQLLPIGPNVALFSIIGTTYGGDGRSTFALPDLRGRVPVRPGSGPGLSSHRLGEKGGFESTTSS